MGGDTSKVPRGGRSPADSSLVMSTPVSFRGGIRSSGRGTGGAVTEPLGSPCDLGIAAAVVEQHCPAPRGGGGCTHRRRRLPRRRHPRASAFRPRPRRRGTAARGGRDFRARIAACDAVLFSTPEYAHALPGALKDALDWLVGSGELVDKPVAVMSASPRSRWWCDRGRRARRPARRARPRRSWSPELAESSAVRTKRGSDGAFTDPATLDAVAGDRGRSQSGRSPLAATGTDAPVVSGVPALRRGGRPVCPAPDQPLGLRRRATVSTLRRLRPG